MYPPIFDGHNDTLTEIFHRAGSENPRTFHERSTLGCIDWQRAKEGGLGGGFFAVFVPNPESDNWDTSPYQWHPEKGYQIPLPPQIKQEYAEEFTTSIINLMNRWQAEYPEHFQLITSIDEFEPSLHSSAVTGILHFEGVEMIHADLSNLQSYYDQGLRSLGPVWSRPNAFAHGVPFCYPQHPDIGDGLTPAGKSLISACNDLGILIDVSHLNYKGFKDIELLSDAPLVATHCGAHALCPSSRNLTDDQLDAIQRSNGIVGVNFCKSFLRPDGNPDGACDHTEIVHQIQFLIQKMGEDHVAFGSDFDGAPMPDDLKDCSKLPLLMESLNAVGLSSETVEKIAWKNWKRVLADTWKG